MVERRRNFSEEFKAEAVRLSRDSGLSVAQVARDLGIGKSTLTSWRRCFADKDITDTSIVDPVKELGRLRRENEILRAERDLLKKATAFFAAETKR